MALFIAIALGGALGSLLRFFISKYIQNKAGLEFPIGTLFVNLTSAFAIGLAFSLLVEKWDISPNLRALIITGILGGYSTYSTLFYEAFYLLINGELVKFSLYILLSNLLGLFFVALGYGFGKLL
ncbi:MAG: fluoride efflux transporter CrcB [Aquificaceae bacterium]